MHTPKRSPQRTPSGSARRLPQFANPWSFRKHREAIAESVADLQGRVAATSEYRRGGARVRVLAAAVARRSNQGAERSVLAELQRRVAVTMVRYRTSGWCTATELRTVEALWVEGISLRALARRDDVAPAAVEARILGLHTKCPEFYRWWRLKHIARRRR